MFSVGISCVTLTRPKKTESSYNTVVCVRVLSTEEFVAGHGVLLSTNKKLLYQGNTAFVVEDRLSSVNKKMGQMP